MKERSIILYGASLPLTKAHRPIVTEGGDVTLYIRAVTYHGDVGAALDNAAPHREESVLNTMPWPPSPPVSPA